MCSDGDVGEIPYRRRDDYPGYYTNPESDAEDTEKAGSRSPWEPWVADEGGTSTSVDRKKEMIIAWRNTYSRTLSRKVIPDIADCEMAAVSAPRSEWGDIWWLP